MKTNYCNYTLESLVSIYQDQLLSPDNKNEILQQILETYYNPYKKIFL